MCKSSASAILRSSSFDHGVIGGFLDLRAQQRLDRAALVHRAVALRQLFEGQRQVEHLAEIDGPIQHEVDQLGQEAGAQARANIPATIGVSMIPGQTALADALEAYSRAALFVSPSTTCLEA